MYFLKRLVLLAVGAALVIVAETAGAQGQPAGNVAGLRLTPVSEAALTAPLRDIYGKVKSVVGPMLTLDVEGRDISLMMDENTDVLARGTSRAASGAGRRMAVTNLVQRGDVAKVSYRERDGAMRVSAIHVSDRNLVASR